MIKIIKIQRYESDLCGNRWEVGFPRYVKATLEEIQQWVEGQQKSLGGYWVEEIKVNSYKSFVKRGYDLSD